MKKPSSYVRSPQTGRIIKAPSIPPWPPLPQPQPRPQPRPRPSQCPSFWDPLPEDAPLEDEGLFAPPEDAPLEDEAHSRWGPQVPTLLGDHNGGARVPTRRRFSGGRLDDLHKELTARHLASPAGKVSVKEWLALAAQMHFGDRPKSICLGCGLKSYYGRNLCVQNRCWVKPNGPRAAQLGFSKKSLKTRKRL